MNVTVEPSDEALRAAAQLVAATIAMPGAVAPPTAPSMPVAKMQDGGHNIDRSSTGFRTRYPARRRQREGVDDRPRLVMGVSTWNRRMYLERFVDTFNTTRDRRFDWTLVIADDGSTDGTVEYARSLVIEDCRVVTIENKGRTISGQTNTILAMAMLLDADLGFKADDDIYFTANGWDSLYFGAVGDSGYDHLIYHNKDWKPAHHSLVEGGLRSSVSVNDSMGCFYTFTPRMIETIGYLDEVNFRFRGHAHIDWSTRAARAGFTEQAHAWDVETSNTLIQMWTKEDYEPLIDWDSEDVKRILNTEERDRRQALIDQIGRVYVPHRVPDANPHLPRIHVIPFDRELAEAANAHSVGYQAQVPAGHFDAVRVLNLPTDVGKWTTTAGILSRAGLEFERFPAADGGLPDYVRAWSEYAARGLELEIERRINRRLIQSTGAWGYLATMEAILEDARQERYSSLLVFDDDVLLHRDFTRAINDVIARLPEDALVLYLGNSQVDPDQAHEIDEVFYHPGGEANGSFAVVIAAAAFDDLIAATSRFDCPFDAGPLREIDHRNRDQVFALHEPLAIADVTTSTIRDPRDMDQYAATFGWDLSLYTPRVGGTTEDRVSVIVVGTDMEATIGGTVESLRHQHHPNLEIICIDNASTDNTLDVLTDLRDRDTRVRVLASPEKRDHQDLVNAALTRVAGSWVSLLPVESALERDHYDTLLTRARAEDAHCVTARAAVGDVPARVAPSGSDRNVEGHATHWGSVIRTDRVMEIGGFVSIDGAGIAEAIERARLAGDKQGNALAHAVSEWATLRLADADSPTMRGSDHHDRIRAGQQSARLPAPVDIALCERI